MSSLAPMSFNEELVWQRNVPTQCSSSITSLGFDVNQIANELEHCIVLCDIPASLAAVRRCSALLTARYIIPIHTRARICHALLALVLSPYHELTSQSEMCVVLHVAWSSHEHRCQLRQYGFTVDWRIIYARISSEYGSWQWSDGDVGKQGRHREASSHENLSALMRVVDGARRFFSPTATKELLSEFVPGLVPSHDTFCISLAMLVRFLPCNTRNQCTSWLPLVLAELQHCDGRTCDRTASALFILVARAVRHTDDPDALSRHHLEILFNRFSQLLDIDIGGHSNIMPNERIWPFYTLMLLGLDKDGAASNTAKSMAKIVVCTLHTNAHTQTLLEQLLHAVRTAYHPSNEDDWSLPLGVFLRCSALYFSKHHGRCQRNLSHTKQSVLFISSTISNRFVKSLLDTALIALYSSLDSMVSSAEMALKCLAYVSPQSVFQALLAEVLPSLDAVTETHRTLSALRALGATAVPMFHRRLHPSGAANLQPLLYATLPAIDACDTNKSVMALTFFWAVFSNVPFHDAADNLHAMSDIDERDGTDETVDEANENARRSTMTLGEWALAFTTRLLGFIVHLDGSSKQHSVNDDTNDNGGASGNSGGMNGVYDLVLLRLIDRTSRSFFSCLSEKLHEQCTRILLDLVTLELHVDSMKPFGMMLNNAVSCRPSSFVPSAINALADRIEPSLLAGARAASTELRWCLYMLSAVVTRSASHCISSIDRIQRICLVTLEHEDKAVRHCSRKLVTNTLRSLTMTYPLEYASVPVSWWNANKAKNAATSDRRNIEHWQWWGRYVEICDDEYDLEIQWYKATRVELDAATRLATSVLQRPQELLKKFALSSSTTPQANYTPPDLKYIHRAVLLFSCVVKGCVNLLGDFDDNECLRSSSPFAKSTLVPRLSFSAFPQFTSISACAMPSLGLHAIPPSSSSSSSCHDNKQHHSLRTRLARLVIAVLNRLALYESSSPLAWQSLISLGEALMYECGVWSKTYTKLCGLNTFARRAHREFLSGRRCVMRSLLVEQAELIYYCRLELCRSRLHLTPVTIELHTVLRRLCLHEQPYICSDAVETSLHCIAAYPELLFELVRFALNAINNDNISYMQLRGVTALLSDEMILLATYNDWSLLRQFITILCRCSRHQHDDRIQPVFQSIFLRHARYFQRMAIYVDMHNNNNNNNNNDSDNNNNDNNDNDARMCNAAQTLSSTIIEQQKQRLLLSGKENEACRTALVNDLLALIQSERVAASTAAASVAKSNNDDDDEKNDDDEDMNAKQIQSERVAASTAAVSVAKSNDDDEKNDDGGGDAEDINAKQIKSERVAASTAAASVAKSNDDDDDEKNDDDGGGAEDINSKEIQSERVAASTAAASVVESKNEDKNDDDGGKDMNAEHNEVEQMALTTATQKTSSTKVCSTVKMHWRYELIASTYVWLLMRDDTATSDAELRHWMSTMTADFAPLRGISFACMSVALMLWRHNTNMSNDYITYRTITQCNDIDDILSPLNNACNVTQLSHSVNTSSQWQQCIFVDDVLAGYRDNHTIHVCTYHHSNDSDITSLSSMPRHLLDECEQCVITELSRIILMLIDDHPSLNGVSSGEHATAAAAATDEGDASEDITGFAYIYTCWPRNRYPAFSKDLDVQHVYLIQLFVESFTSTNKLVPALLAKLTNLVRYISNVEKQVTAAELFAGIVRGTRHWPFNAQQAIRAPLLAALKVIVERCALESLDSWADAMRFCADAADPRRVLWLVKPLLHLARSLPSLAPSVQMRCLRLLSSFVIEFSWRGRALHNDIYALILEHSNVIGAYQQVREELATILFLIRNLDLRIDSSGLYNISRAEMHTKFSNCLLDKIDAEVQSSSSLPLVTTTNVITNISDEQQTQTSSIDETVNVSSHLLDTSLYWLMSSFTNGEVCTFVDVFVQMLPYVLAAAQHSNRELADLAKYVADVSSWMCYSREELDSILSQIEIIASNRSSSWHVRRGALDLLVHLCPRHAFILSETHVHSMVELLARLLQDTQLEIRALAGVVLSGLVSSTSGRISLSTLVTRFSVLANTRIVSGRKRRRVSDANLSVSTTISSEATSITSDNTSPSSAASSSSSSASSSALSLYRRHAGVLGLGALVNSEPYDLPHWMPSTLALLCEHMNDPPPIDATVCEVLSQFKRTHQDTWHLLRRQFTQAQLDALTAAYVAPSYFV